MGEPVSAPVFKAMVDDLYRVNPKLFWDRLMALIEAEEDESDQELEQ